MSELYYRNLGEFENIGLIMKDVFDGLNPFYRYLSSVREYLESQVISFNFVHLDGSPVDIEDEEDEIIGLSIQADDDLSENTDDIESIKRDGYWIQIDDEEIETNQRTFEEVLSQRSYYTKKPKGRYWDITDSIRVLQTEPKYAAVCLSKKPENLILHVRPNTYQINRIISSINLLQDRPSHHHLPLIKLFQKVDTHVDWPEFNSQKIENYYFLKDNRSGVKVQREFVEIALSTPDYAILNGPPGTGKTQVICEIVIQEILKGNRIILVASTHVAVDNVLERIMNDPFAENLVFPIRIGDEKNIANELRKFTYSRMKLTEKNRIIDRLKKLRKRTNSQDLLFRSLSSKDSGQIIDEAILDAANLICGTTIGILQFPPIRNMQNSMPTALFDTLILDEASKTPFYEFLVPALYAKKWILSGDPRQLSPYVDEKDVEVSIDSIVKESNISKDSIISILPLLKSNRFGKRGKFVLVISNDYEILDQYKIQSERLFNFENIDKRVLGISDLENSNLQIDMKEMLLWTSDVVYIHIDEFEKYKNLLPDDFNIFVHLKDQADLNLEFINKIPREYLSKLKSFHGKGRYFLDTKDKWNYELGYRLARRFELRKDPKRIHKIDNEIQLLTPANKTFKKNLSLVRQIFFPSVLESLLEGFELGRSHFLGTTLTDGLPDDAKLDRFRLLKYQHRMHSQISKFPSTHIYLGKSLLNAATIDELRSPWYTSSRMKWIHVWRTKRLEGKEPTSNLDEVKVIERELIKFENWTEKTKKHDGFQWTVAVLTFYRSQERELRFMLRKLFNQRTRWRTFNRKNIKVEVCTVDRFQGHEADLVFLSFVNNSRIGFLDVPNRLNVAITRARYELVLVGNRNYFNNCRSDFLKLLAREIPTDKVYENE